MSEAMEEEKEKVYESDMLGDDWYRKAPLEEFDWEDYNRMYFENDSNGFDNPYYTSQLDLGGQNNSNNPLECDICKRVYKRKANLDNHKQSCHSKIIDKPFKCDKCPYSASFAAYLKRHRRVHERPPDDDDKHHCDVCSFTTLSLSDLRNHSLTHLGYKPFKCDACGFLTTHEGLLNKHKKRKHPEEPKEEEEELPQEEQEEELLMKPKDDCSEVEEIDVVGDDIVKEATVDEGTKDDSKSDKDAEIDEDDDSLESSPLTSPEPPSEELRKSTVFLTTSADRRYKCDQCGFSSNHKLRFKEHKSVHTGQYPYNCIHCNYHTARKSDFDEHKRLHSRQTGFKCQRCNIYFKWRADLDFHMTKHLKKRATAFKEYVYVPSKSKKKVEYRCHECDAVLSDRRLLARHKEEHRQPPTPPPPPPPPPSKPTPKPKVTNFKSSHHFCLFCRVTFKTRQELNLHKSIHVRTCELKLHRLPDAKNYYTIGLLHTPIEPNIPFIRPGPRSRKNRVRRISIPIFTPVPGSKTGSVELAPFWTNQLPICENITRAEPNSDSITATANSVEAVKEIASRFSVDPNLVNPNAKNIVAANPILDNLIGNVKSEPFQDSYVDINRQKSETETVVKTEIKSEPSLISAATNDDLDFWVEAEVSGKGDCEELDVVCVSDSDNDDGYSKINGYHDPDSDDGYHEPNSAGSLLEHYLSQPTAKTVANRFISNGGKSKGTGQAIPDIFDSAPLVITAPIYRCEKCDFQSGQKFAFKKHQKLHSEKRKYACNFCGLRFKRRLRLFQHSFVHAKG